METIVSNRILEVKGGYNFRDLGTLLTKDGRIIKKDLLFRTDELSNLQPEDLELLANLNIQTIVDFRTDMEREHSVDKVPTTCKNQIHLDIVSANMNAFMDEIKNGGTQFKSLLLQFYKDLVLDENAIREYKKFFEILQKPENTAIIYHCTAGKDRTGIATAFILEALQVSRADIEADYMLSNQFLKKKYESYLTQNPALSDLFLVQPDYLNTAFETIETNYQSVQNYLQTVLGVDFNLMKEIYTKKQSL